MPRPPSDRLASALGTTSSRPTRGEPGGGDPVWIRLASSRLPTSVLSRSVSSSIVARNSAVSSAVHATSSWRRLLTAALTDASGVRRSWETAARIAVRSSLHLDQLRGLLRLPLERRGRARPPAAARRTRPAPGALSAGQAGPRITSDASSPSSSVSDPSSGVGGGFGPADASTTHAVVVAAQHRRPPPGRTSCAGARRGRAAGRRSASEPAGQARERLGLRRPRCASTRSRAARSTSPLTTRRDERRTRRSRTGSRAPRSSTCGSAA